MLASLWISWCNMQPFFFFTSAKTKRKAGGNSHPDYQRNIEKSVTPFNREQKKRLKKCHILAPSQECRTVHHVGEASGTARKGFQFSRATQPKDSSLALTLPFFLALWQALSTFRRHKKVQKNIYVEV